VEQSISKRVNAENTGGQPVTRHIRIQAHKSNKCTKRQSQTTKETSEEEQRKSQEDNKTQQKGR